jgi:hypothetical protein
LCDEDGCRLLRGHLGTHKSFPTEAWSFFDKRDKDKITKAGFATPRGGSKGAYQNHVLRSGKVIVPFERLPQVSVAQYKDGYVVRLHPDQYFEGPQKPKPEFLGTTASVRVGDNAFVLYRSYEIFEAFPPMTAWRERSLTLDGQPAAKRSRSTADEGEYVLRMPRRGSLPARKEGAPQGIFAPEYAENSVNYLCQAVLAWLIIQAKGSPYTTSQASHLLLILRDAGLDDAASYETQGSLRHGLTSCPLCLRFIKHSELHDSVDFEEAIGLANAGLQVEGATRSTVVNLFHMRPLVYMPLEHVPSNVAWGHAICNTRLGQRVCYTLGELITTDLKVGILREEGIDTFGWISEDRQMIRSPDGAVWVQLNGDGADGPPVPPPLDPDLLDEPDDPAPENKQDLDES